MVPVTGLFVNVNIAAGLLLDRNIKDVCRFEQGGVVVRFLRLTGKGQRVVRLFDALADDEVGLNLNFKHAYIVCQFGLLKSRARPSDTALVITGG